MMQLVAWMQGQASVILGVTPENIDVEASFEALGFDSADGIVFIGALEDHLDLQLSQAEVFRRQSIVRLAHYCQERRPDLLQQQSTPTLAALQAGEPERTPLRPLDARLHDGAGGTSLHSPPTVELRPPRSVAGRSPSIHALP